MSKRPSENPSPVVYPSQRLAWSSIERAVLVLATRLRSLPAKGLRKLANARHERWVRTERVSDLDDAIRWYKRSLEHCLPKDLGRVVILEGLADALDDRYDLTKAPADLEETIDYTKELLDCCPYDDPRRAMCLHNLAVSLTHHFELTKDLDRINAIVLLYKEAIGLDDHQYHDETVQNLASALRVRYALTKAHDSLDEVIHACQAALEICPPGHEDRPLALTNLANSFDDQSVRTQDPNFSRRALELHAELLALHPPGHPDRAMILTNYAISLGHEYEYRYCVQSLEQAIAHLREVVVLCPTGHAKHVASLWLLASALDDRYESTGNPLFLQEAIKLCKVALEECPEDYNQRDDILSGYAISLHHLYGVSGDLAALHEAIGLQKELLERQPVGHADRAATLYNLISSLGDQSHFTGMKAPLEDALSLYDEFLRLHPEGHPDRAMVLLNASSTRNSSFWRMGNIDSLEDSIRLAQEALLLRPEGHAGRFAALLQLAQTLYARYQCTDDEESLTDALRFYESALAECPVGQIQRSAIFNGLAGGLASKFYRSHDPALLERILGLFDQALELRALGDPSRIQTLGRVTHILNAQFFVTQKVPFLEKAIAYGREALKICPEAHSARSEIMSALATSLYYHVQHTGDSKHAQEALLYANESLQLSIEDHPDHLIRHLHLSRVHYGKHAPQPDYRLAISRILKATSHPYASPRIRMLQVIPYLSEIEDEFAANPKDEESVRADLLDVYTELIHLIPRVAFFSLDLSSRLRELARSKDLAAAAALHAVALGRLHVGLELLEQARAVFWSQALNLRSPLEDIPSDAAAQLQDLFRELEKGSHAHENALAMPAWGNQMLVSHRRRGAEAERIIDEVRKLPGLERFLLAKPFSLLAEAAARGPVVVLISARGTCAAILLRHPDSAPEHVLLPQLTEDILKRLTEDVQASNLRGGTGGEGKSPSAERLTKKSAPGSQYSGDKLLEALWRYVVGPVKSALALKVSNLLIKSRQN